jgi:putative spermidine/putrescine transport system permease protein
MHRVFNRRTASTLIGLSPAIVLIGGFFLLPLLRLVAISLSDSYPRPTDRLTWENYVGVFERAFHVDALLNSLRLSTIVTIITALIGYPVAYYLVRAQSRLKPYVMVAIISPLLISIVVRSLGWLVLLGREGVLNQVLVGMGIFDEPVQMLYTFGAVVVGEVHILLPFMVLSLTTALGQIPPSLDEGAAVLGAGRMRRFWRITVPLSTPGLVSGCVLVFVLTMGSYVTPQLLGGGKVNVVTTDIYSRMMVEFDWPMGSALSIVTLVGTLAIVWLAGRVQNRLMLGRSS